MAKFSLLFMLAALLVVVPEKMLAKKSRFNKKINLTALEEGYATDEDEDDDWHEDTFEWKEKMRKKQEQTVQVDFSKMKDGKLDASELTKVRGGMQGGGMKMMFATVQTESRKRQKDWRPSGLTSFAMGGFMRSHMW